LGLDTLRSKHSQHFLSGVVDGYCLFDIDGGIFCGNRFVDLGLRVAKGATMSWVYMLSGIMVLVVFVYLVVALFYTEKL